MPQARTALTASQTFYQSGNAFHMFRMPSGYTHFILVRNVECENNMFASNKNTTGYLTDEEILI